MGHIGGSVGQEWTLNEVLRGNLKGVEYTA